MTPVISVQNVSKKFSFNEDASRDIKTNLIKLLTFQLGKGTLRIFEVLDDISFDIYPGEFVGIMGRNGVGKSTILKIISGVYTPNQGRVVCNDKIAPLLELGAGFSPELSGYENIFLNAAILGYGRERTLQSLETIIDFAELRDRIHLPVKKYSSGMIMRLGFSVAVHLDAPVLLFDEVLGVGDAGFVKKCLEKVQQLHASGRTIVLVTHDAEAVKENCTRCIVIDNKKKIFDGPADEGSARYLGVFGQ